MDLLGGVMDFNTVDAFGMVLETGLTLVLVNVKRLRGARALIEPIDSNRSFPVMSTFSIVLAALETLRHMLDFKFGIWAANLWLGDLDNHIRYEYCQLFDCESECVIGCFGLRESVLTDS